MLNFPVKLGISCVFMILTISLFSSILCDFKYLFYFLFLFQVREGLKKYSNWPTYPQLYVNGELVGGLDILKVSSYSVLVLILCNFIMRLSLRMCFQHALQ